MNLDSLFTLIVPVRDRHYNLPSIIHYYKNTSYRKIIYDASEKPFDGPVGNFEYHHAGPEFQHQSYLNAYKMSDTPFLINCPDDDIMTHDSIRRCIGFLKDNSDYSACDGEVVEWVPGDDFVSPAPKPDVFRARTLHDWDADDIFQRIRFGVVDCSRSCMHSFIKTDDAIHIMQNFMNNPEITPLSFLDRVYTFASLCRGKIKTLPVVQHVRTSNHRPNADRNMFNPEIANEEIDGFGLKLDVAMRDLIDVKHCSKFSHYLEENSDLNDQEALQWTINLYNEHFLQRDKNGGGGYFGRSHDTTKVILPCKTKESGVIISEAIDSMSKAEP